MKVEYFKCLECGNFFKIVSNCNVEQVMCPACEGMNVDYATDEQIQKLDREI